ncbi:glycolipid transfer protein domain-containing protein [Dipodascopsis tothii]|uniref:glycolipid transfer protein domain-containing protein n=1 Tax=Dipodascopsis tothii TaxID=44089 RepID=UPI0034CE491D
MSSATFFDEMKTSFAAVPVSDDGQVSTTEFLAASESLISLFDLLGSSAFTVVQKDMTGNVKKIREKQATDPAAFGTLQGIVLAEAGQKSRTATQGLLWLTRALHFTATALRRNVDSDEELTESFTKAYSETLIKFHSIVVRPVFKLAMKATPYRKDFYAKLGGDLAKVKAQLIEWLSALEAIVKNIQAFFESGNYGKGL